jgi:hypothetical protein
MMKYVIFAIALILGCLVVPVVQPATAGSSCHGKKPVRPASTIVEQSVEVEPGVVVRESVEVDGPGNVVVKESVEVGGPSNSPALSVHTARKDARREKRATVAEAKSERKAGRFAKKASTADHEADAQSAVKKAYDSN